MLCVGQATVKPKIEYSKYAVCWLGNGKIVQRVGELGY